MKWVLPTFYIADVRGMKPMRPEDDGRAEVPFAYQTDVRHCVHEILFRLRFPNQRTVGEIANRLRSGRAGQHASTVSNRGVSRTSPSNRTYRPSVSRSHVFPTFWV